MSFTFEQPVIDQPAEPAPAPSVLAAVNYDRSPSLVDLEPESPIQPQEFKSFTEAKQAFEAFLPGCNWPKPPSLKRFWYESEKHLTAGVDYISWGFREHPFWIAVSNGEIIERTEENEESVGGSIVLVETVETPQRGYAFAERQAQAIAEGLSKKVFIDGKPIEQAIQETECQSGEGAVKPTDQTTGVVDQTPEVSDQTTGPAAPTVRRKYTPEQYAELRKRADEDFAIELQRLENQYADLSMERAKQEDMVKGLKAEERAKLDSLRMFKANGPKYPANPELKEGETGASDIAASAGASGAARDSNQEGSPSPHDITEERYQRYCALPLLPVLKDVKGLGSAKLSMLIDQFPTVGKLLEHQKEKGQLWYKSVGKGFGPELANRIEDAAADALKTV